MASNSGTERSKAPCGPPTMMVRVPSRAPTSPPLTGASRAWTSFCARRSASMRAVSGLIVLLSMKTVPGSAPSRIPFAPRTTCSTSGESGKLVHRNSTCPATSAGELAALAPSATSASTMARLRLWTTSSWPAFIRLRAMAAPMMPSPMYPIFAIWRSLSCAFSPCGSPETVAEFPALDESGPAAWARPQRPGPK